MRISRAQKDTIIIVIISLIGNLLLPSPYAFAENEEERPLPVREEVLVVSPSAPFLNGQSFQEVEQPQEPPSPKKQKQRIMLVLATAYSSTVDQTDASPCTTANGFNVCKHGQENVVAANFLPFGTRVRFPDHFGDRVFTVQDRMHRRFSSRVDFWMKDRHSAKQFGVKRLKMEIVNEQVAVNL